MGFSDILISWYIEYKRNLPWRNTNAPYNIWLSEIILQQTKVAQGLSYYEKFIDAYPSIEDLAADKEDNVLKMWQGLGYYSRARNLHYTAKYISNELEGVFPDKFDEIIKLKGVGAYTGAAIASFCFNEPVAVVDGNVFRVLSRYYNINTPIDSSQGKRIFWELANECLNKANPAEHNQAIMEFGALQCTPKPNCETCPLIGSCMAYSNNTIKSLPVKSKKIKVRKRYFNFIVVSDAEYCLIEKRITKDIWRNLYQFPLVELEKECLSPLEFSKELTKGAIFIEVSEQFKHVLSHQLIFAKFWQFKVGKIESLKGHEKVSLKDIHKYAVPRLIEKYLETL